MMPVFSPKTILFRCDASPSMGGGHLMRCQTLAKALVTLGWQADLWLNADGVDFLSPQHPFRRVVTEEAAMVAGYDWLLVDHYGVAAPEEAQLSQYAAHVAVLDDLYNRPHACDLLIDQTLGTMETHYAGLVPDKTTLLCGAAYALLADSFVARRETVLRRWNEPIKTPRLLVSLGMTDPVNATGLVLQVLQKIDPPYALDVVIGSHAPCLAAVQSAFNALPIADKTLHIGTNAMADLMANAHLAIGAGGTTAWERCCLALPTLGIEIADNQRHVLAELDKTGALKNLGPINTVTPQAVADAVNTMLSQPEKLKAMALQAAQVCDGFGASRVALHIDPLLTKTGQPLTLQLAQTEADARLLYQWQCEPGARTFSRNPDPPEWEDHWAWFQATRHNPARVLHLLRLAGDPVGMLRLDRQTNAEKTTYEVSILVSQIAQGQGVALAALQAARRLQPNAVLHAYIQPENTASMALFARAGYTALAEQPNWFVQVPVITEPLTPCPA